MAAKLQHRVGHGLQHGAKAGQAGTGELAGVVERADYRVIGFAVGDRLDLRQPMGAGVITERRTVQLPDRLTTWIGATQPAGDGGIQNPPVTLLSIGGAIETEIGGLHRGVALVE